MTWKGLDTEILSEFADASRARGHVRSTDRQRYLDSLPWSLREETAALVHDELGPEDAAVLTGPAWPDVEDYLWRMQQVRRVEERARARDYYSRLPERRERSRRARERRSIQRGHIVGVRCCPICRSMYVVTAYHSISGQDGACSPAHRYLASGEKAGAWRLVTIGRERDSLAGWAKRSGLTDAAVRYRIRQLGWSITKAISTPATPRNERRWRDDGSTIASRAREAGVDAGLVRNRLRDGWSEEEAIATAPGARPRERKTDGLLQRVSASGISYAAFQKRRANGMSEAEALATPLQAPAVRRWRGERGPLESAILAAVAEGVRGAGEVVEFVRSKLPHTGAGSVRTTLSKLVRNGELARSGDAGAYRYGAVDVAISDTRAA